jgi:hypothetical protein
LITFTFYFAKAKAVTEYVSKTCMHTCTRMVYVNLPIDTTAFKNKTPRGFYF